MRTEDDLRAALASLEAGAPGVADVLPAPAPRPSRSRTWMLAVAAAIAVAAVATGTALVAGSGGQHGHPAGATGSAVPTNPATSPPATGTPPGPPPASLTDVTWELTDVRPGGMSARSVPVPMLIRADGDVQIDVDTCDYWLGTAGFAGTVARLAGRVEPHSCPAPPPGQPRPDVQARTALIDAIVHGEVTWVLHGDDLTVTKAGVGSLTFHRGPVDPPSPSSPSDGSR